jgi:hypothetical protein
LETALLRRLQNVFAIINREADAGDFKVIIVFYFKVGQTYFETRGFLILSGVEIRRNHQRFGIISNNEGERENYT